MSDLKPGEFLRVPNKNPDRTGAGYQIFEVLEVQYKVRVRYTEGNGKGCITNFIIPIDKAREYRDNAPTCKLCGHPEVSP